MGFSVQHLTFCHSQASKPVCDGFNLSVEDGEVIAILGRNGSGKSTFLRLLAGLEHPTTNDGKDTNTNTSIELFEGPNRIVKSDSRTWHECLIKHASLVFQQYTDVVFEWQKVNEALEWVRSEKDDYYVNVVSLFPALTLPAGQEKYWGQLSGGQKQSLALARGLLRDPDILLLDEPFASFDASLRHSIQDSLVKAHSNHGKKHRVMILVTHDIEEAVFLADRILIVNGPPLEIVREVKCPRPFSQRDTSYRWSQEFVDVRKVVLEEFSKLPLPGT